MVLKTNPEVICRRIDEGFFLLSTSKVWLECPYIQQISDTAAFYWDLMERGYSIESIIERTLKVYDITKEVAEEDLNQFIDQLLRNNYLEIN